MSITKFVHLHVHSDYSILDSICKTDDIIASAENQNMPAVALTDQNSMSGLVEFYSEAQTKSIQPILGMEIDIESANNLVSPFVLLAYDEIGYKNLIGLTSVANNNNSTRPCIMDLFLHQFSKGLVGITGAMESELAHLILNNSQEKAEKLVQTYADIFGQDNFYLELQKNGIAGQEKLNAALIDVGRRLKIPLIATNDVHYIHKEDARAYDILLRIRHERYAQDIERQVKKTTGEFFFKTAEEMADLFSDVPEAITNTLAIAERCNVNLDLGHKHLPRIKLPVDKTSQAYLRELAEQGLKREYPDSQVIPIERLNLELDAINKNALADYILILWDLLRFAKNNNIKFSPGRDSAGASIVLYSLGITDIDPIKYELSCDASFYGDTNGFPAISFDFSESGRKHILNYLKEKYGNANTCEIETSGKMMARSALRHTGKLLNLPSEKIEQIIEKLSAKPAINLKDALTTNAQLKEMAKDPSIQELFEIAAKLERIITITTTSAAGIVIADTAVEEYAPVEFSVGERIALYPSKSLRKLGLLRIDILGLRILDVITETLGLIKGSYGVDLSFENIPLDDKETYDMICRGETAGVYQLDYEKPKELCLRLKPAKIEDIILLLSICRPLAFEKGLVGMIVKRKNGEDNILYFHPLLEPVLAETYGVLIYQEQAEKIIKSLHIKEPMLVNSEKGSVKSSSEDILQGVARLCIENECTVSKAKHIGYAMLAVKTAYLKAHYPKEFAKITEIFL